jgi:hypothetical protein
MSADFFTRFFAALDGPEPLSSMEMVAADAEFAILFATEPGRRSGHFTGGPEELRSFTEAGDMEGWAHYVIAGSTVGNKEVVLGETRTDDGEVLGTFVCAVELDDEGLMKRYIVGRSPQIRFDQ